MAEAIPSADVLHMEQERGAFKDNSGLAVDFGQARDWRESNHDRKIAHNKGIMLFVLAVVAPKF